MEVLEALQTLDPAHAGHWTADGSPRVDVISAIVGRTLTRLDLAGAAPDFNRETHRKVLDAARQHDADPQGASRGRAAAAVQQRWGRTWLYHSSCPKGQVFEGQAVAAQLNDGWVDSPAKVKAGASKPPK